MNLTAQLFGIAGFLFTVVSFQERNIKKFFIMQAIAGFMFFMNFAIMGALSAALFNLVNLVRGALLSKKEHKPWHLGTIEILYTVCFVISLIVINGDLFQIFLSSLTYFALVLMTIFMWKGNGKYIRYVQLFVVSPAWIIHNIFNFSLGGLLCEIFSMLSVIVSFIRYKQSGFEN